MKVTILQYKSIILYNEINKVQQIATIEKHIDIQIIHSLPARGPLKAAPEAANCKRTLFEDSH